MRIVFEASTLHQSKTGSVTAVVYFEFDSLQQFPVAGWNDFVIVIVGWWVDALAQIAQGQEEVELRFMDGPYWITAVSRGEKELLLRCVEDRPNGGVVHETVVLLDDLSREVTALARRISQECAIRAIESPDLAQLRAHQLN